VTLRRALPAAASPPQPFRARDASGVVTRQPPDPSQPTEPVSDPVQPVDQLRTVRSLSQDAAPSARARRRGRTLCRGSRPSDRAGPAGRPSPRSLFRWRAIAEIDQPRARNACASTSSSRDSIRTRVPSIARCMAARASRRKRLASYRLFNWLVRAPYRVGSARPRQPWHRRVDALGKVDNLMQEFVGFSIQLESVAVDRGAGVPDDVPGWLLVASGVDKMALR
jgi:hypothetical protein